jgi:hypothetical protein
MASLSSVALTKTVIHSSMKMETFWALTENHFWDQMANRLAKELLDLTVKCLALMANQSATKMEILLRLPLELLSKTRTEISWDLMVNLFLDLMASQLVKVHRLF